MLLEFVAMVYRTMLNLQQSTSVCLGASERRLWFSLNVLLYARTIGSTTTGLAVAATRNDCGYGPNLCRAREGPCAWDSD